MRLRLVQLPARPACGLYPSYRLAAAVQELVRRQFLHAKENDGRRAAPADTPGGPDGPGSPGSPGDSDRTLLSLLVRPPPPTVIAFTPPPTYTLGRRQHAAQLTAADRHRLTAPLEVPVPDADEDEDGDGARDAPAVSDAPATTFLPALARTRRGGLTTYHGPGQAVLWPVLDLKSRLFRRAEPLTVRTYSRLLETTTAETLRRRFGLAAYTTADPGLWVQSPRPSPASHDSNDRTDIPAEERKIAALGVHLRRNVSALGVAVNLDMPVTWAAAAADAPVPSPNNPWRRFVPCGLAGRGVSCVADEARLRFGGHVPAAWDLQPAPFAAKWCAELATQLGLTNPDVDVADAATVAQLISDAEELLALGALDEVDDVDSLGDDSEASS